MQTWALSFINQKKHLGIIIVDAQNFLCAVVKTHHLGINPSGAVKGVLVTKKINKQYKNKILSTYQVKAANRIGA